MTYQDDLDVTTLATMPCRTRSISFLLGQGNAQPDGLPHKTSSTCLSHSPQGNPRRLAPQWCLQGCVAREDLAQSQTDIWPSPALPTPTVTATTALPAPFRVVLSTQLINLRGRFHHHMVIFFNEEVVKDDIGCFSPCFKSGNQYIKAICI